MCSTLKNFYLKFRNLFLYGIIGCLSSSLDFLIYTILIHIGIYYLIANCISVLAGITTSFTLNRQYNFKVKDSTVRRFSIFLAVGVCGMLLSNIILYVCVDILVVDILLSKILSIIFVVILQFIINKYITFKPSCNE